jgi:dienelactone hydrolase
MRRALALLAVLLVTIAGSPVPASAQVYPVDNLLASLDGPMADLMTPHTRNYNFEEGTYGAIRRILQAYPERYTDPEMDAQHEAQVAYDSAFHVRPRPPYSHFGDVGHASYTPDWDHDGAYGDGGGMDPNGVGDFTIDTDDVMDTAYFLMPCLAAADPHPVHYRYTNGACDERDEQKLPYVVGVARELRFVNSRGLELDGTLWIPPQAFVGTGCPVPGTPAYASRQGWTRCISPANLTARRLPAIVWANGLASRQDHYYWIAMRMAWAGYVVLTYDPAGQGESEGSGGDLTGPTDLVAPESCRYPGACQDLEDAVRWFSGVRVTPVEASGFRIEAHRDPLKQAPSPVRSLVDRARLGLGGHSMGGATVHSYLRGLAAGAGFDGRSLPKLAAAVSMSYSAPATAVVPLQLQTSDHDGSPYGPTVLQANGEGQGEGIGYTRHKQGYDAIREGRGRGAVSLIVLEGGTHTDFIDQPFIFKTPWANYVAGHYAQAWFDCHVKRARAACVAGTRPIPHLSRSFASEQDPDGPGPRPSRCIAVPDQWSLAQDPQRLATAATDAAPYDCATVPSKR